MSNELRAAAGLEGLPTVEAIFRQLNPIHQNVFLPLLSRMPLIKLLGEIIRYAAATSEQQRDLLLRLARLAIAKHEYTRKLYSTVVDAVMMSQPQAEILPADLPAIDAPLVMEMLALIAEVLAVVNAPDKGLYAFQIAYRVADHFGLQSNRAIVLHQVGVYEMRRRRFVEAEASLKQAADLFSATNPDMQRQTNLLRVRIYSLRMRLELEPTAPDDLETIVAADSQAGVVLLLAQAAKAIDRDDLTKAENHCQQLAQHLPNVEAWPIQFFLIRARLARRKGQFELADIWLRRANSHPDAASQRSELSWQTFYLARDLGEPERARTLIQELPWSDDPIRVEYQRALVARDVGETEKAAEIFRQCLNATDDDAMRANCLGMLARVLPDPAEANRCLHQAIALYVKLDRKLDHALTLSQLAINELREALARKESGELMIGLYQFTRCDNLLLRAQEITRSLGVDAVELDLVTYRARLEMERERYKVALRHFERSTELVEVTYLAITDHERAELFIKSNSELYALAITCSLKAGRPDQALLFSERSKARRFLRDASEAVTVEERPSPHETLTEELSLLAKIAPLRRRVLQQRPLSAREQEILYDAEHKVIAVRQRLRATSELVADLAGRIHQPVAVGELRELVFGQPISDSPPREEQDEAVQELPGGSVMQCSQCFVYNRIASTFCSACEELLPKSVEENLNVLFGNASEEELTQAFADQLYNHAVELFHNGAFKEAEPLFRQALEHSEHPDYSFFHGLCLLLMHRLSEARMSFAAVTERQFSSKYPFWSVPISPSDFRQCMDLVKQDQTNGEAAAKCLMTGYGAYSERRQLERCSLTREG